MDLHLAPASAWWAELPWWLVLCMARPTTTDPTGQRANRRKTYRQLAARLRAAQAKVLAEVKGIKYTKKIQQPIANVDLVLYQYDMSAADMEVLALAIQSHLERELDVMPADMPIDWWYKKEVELPYRQGGLGALVEATQAVTAATVATGSPLAAAPILPPDSFLLSPRYLDGVRQAQVRNYGLIRSLSQDTAKQLYTVIENNIQGGRSMVEIIDDIHTRFGVSDSSAKRLAATEVNRAYNDARLSSVSGVRDASGQDVGVLHISSLLPTTRDDHAARHGNAYTPEQETQWWNTGANRINCHCTTRTVVFKDGKVIESELQKRIKDQRDVG